MWNFSASRFFIFGASKIRHMIKYIAVIVLAVLVGVVLYQPTENPIIGRWVATEPVYGKSELLTFTEFGLLRDGSHIPADFAIERNKVTVTTNAISNEYFFVNENLIKQRVPRQTWRYFSRAAENSTSVPVVETAEPAQQGNISRYKS